MSDCTLLGLVKGDRLEPSVLHRDVVSIDQRRDFPFQISVWTWDPNSLCRHRNPLLDPSTYLTPDRFVADEMHTMHLGLFDRFCSTALWACVAENIFQVGIGRTMDHREEMMAQRIEKDLTAWYAAEKKRYPAKPVHQLADFKLACLGPKDGPTLVGPKAAETGTLVLYTVDLLRRYKDRLERGEALYAAGQCLCKYLSISRTAGPRLSMAQRQSILDAVVRFNACREAAGLAWSPKFHLALHLVQQCGEFGNPLHRATWVDESLNRQLRDVCSKAHALVWTRRVLTTMMHVLATTKTGQQVKRRRTD